MKYRTGIAMLLASIVLTGCSTTATSLENDIAKLTAENEQLKEQINKGVDTDEQAPAEATEEIDVKQLQFEHDELQQRYADVATQLRAYKKNVVRIEHEIPLQTIIETESHKQYIVVQFEGDRDSVLPLPEQVFRVNEGTPYHSINVSADGAVATINIEAQPFHIQMQDAEAKQFFLDKLMFSFFTNFAELQEVHILADGVQWPNSTKPAILTRQQFETYSYQLEIIKH